MVDVSPQATRSVRINSVSCVLVLSDTTFLVPVPRGFFGPVGERTDGSELGGTGSRMEKAVQYLRCRNQVQESTKENIG